MATTTQISSAAEIKSITEQGVFSGYAALFNTPDLSGELIAPGAFKDSLAAMTHKLPLLFSHETSEPIGIFRVVKEDSKGLYVEGELNLNTQSGKDAYSLLKQGALTGLSIAFLPVDFVPNKDGSRTITKLTLLEISLTPVPAQPKAQVTSVRSLGPKDAAEDWTSIIAALRDFVQ